MSRHLVIPTCCICGRLAGRAEPLYQRIAWPIRQRDLVEDRSRKRDIKERDSRRLQQAPSSVRVAVELPAIGGDARYDWFCQKCAMEAIKRLAMSMFPRLREEREDDA